MPVNLLIIQFFLFFYLVCNFFCFLVKEMATPDGLLTSFIGVGSNFKVVGGGGGGWDLYGVMLT